MQKEPGEEDSSAKKRKQRRGNEDYPCTICGKNFVRRGFLERHLKLHDGGSLGGVGGTEPFVVKRPYKPETRKFNCHLCGVMISRSSKYYHMKYIHKIGFEVHTCYCGKEYSSKLGLKKHHLSHTGERLPMTTDSFIIPAL